MKILLVTNILCLILQSDRKGFVAVSRAVKSTITILWDIQNNDNSTHLQNFKKTDEIIQKLSTIAEIVVTIFLIVNLQQI